MIIGIIVRAGVCQNLEKANCNHTRKVKERKNKNAAARNEELKPLSIYLADNLFIFSYQLSVHLKPGTLNVRLVVTRRQKFSFIYLAFVSFHLLDQSPFLPNGLTGKFQEKNPTYVTLHLYSLHFGCILFPLTRCLPVQRFVSKQATFVQGFLFFFTYIFYICMQFIDVAWRSHNSERLLTIVKHWIEECERRWICIRLLIRLVISIGCIFHEREAEMLKNLCISYFRTWELCWGFSRIASDSCTKNERGVWTVKYWNWL